MTAPASRAATTWLAASALWISLVLPAFALELSAEFQAARDRWLTGDDSAYERLSSLALGGDIAAQILLGRASHGGKYTAPGDRSWLEVAAETSPLARALLASTPIGPRTGKTDDHLKLLSEANESSAVISILRWQRQISPAAKQSLLWSSPDGFVKYTILSADLSARRLDPATTAQACEAALEQPQPFAPLRMICAARPGTARLLAQNFIAVGIVKSDLGISARAYVNWIASDPRMRPYAGICEQMCPESAGTCGHALYAATHGQTGLGLHGTPSASIVSEDEYFSSRRAMKDLWRIARKLGPWKSKTSSQRKFVESVGGQCLLDALARHEWLPGG